MPQPFLEQQNDPLSQGSAFSMDQISNSDTPQGSSIASDLSQGQAFSTQNSLQSGAAFGDDNQIPVDVRDASELQGSQDFNGFCETFAEQVAGLPQMGDTAIDAAQNFAQQGKLNSNWQQAPVGSLIYFYDPNQPAGHVGIISDNNGNFISATYQGVRQDNLQSWIQSTGQQPLGFVNPNSQ